MDQREIFDSEHAVKADKTVSFEVAQNSVQFSGPMGESPAPPAVPTPAPSPTPSPTPASTTSRSTKGKKRGHSKFQTHELTVDPGGDVMVKIMSLSLQAPHAICILSANGTISKVTIRGRIPGETSTFEVRTFRGHANEKNFVGLTVSSEYIACGSETNKVFVYHKIRGKMEERDVLRSGQVVRVNEAPQSFNLAQNTLQFSGPTVEAPAPVTSPVNFPAVMAGSTEGKKKRGRPRKCDSAGKVPLSPMPISSSIPLTGEFSGWKRGSGKPFESIKKSSKLYYFEGKPENATSAGSNLEIHVLTVNSGEDVTMKIMDLAQKGFHGICILSANGTIKNVTLRQATSSGGTSTYEGIFEILSLTGSFMPTENGFTKSRSGGLSVQLATTDGRVMGGGLAGLLIAATPVRVVVGSFLPPGHAPEPKVRKQKVEHKSTPHVNHANPVSAEMKMDVDGIKPFITSSGFQIQHIGFNNGHDSRNSSAAAAETLEKESDLTHSDTGAAC